MSANASYLLRKASRKTGGRARRRHSLSTVWNLELLQDFEAAVFHGQHDHAFVGGRVTALREGEGTHDAVEVGLVKRIADLVALSGAGGIDGLRHDVHRVISLCRELIGVLAVALLEAG